jgi:hypothetical protein
MQNRYLSMYEDFFSPSCHSHVFLWMQEVDAGTTSRNPEVHIHARKDRFLTRKEQDDRAS